MKPQHGPISTPRTGGFVLKIDKLQNILGTIEQNKKFTPYTLTGPEQKDSPCLYWTDGSMQKNEDRSKPTTIHVGPDCPHAVITITIDSDENVVPVGIAFQRADGTKPNGVVCSTDPWRPKDPAHPEEPNDSTPFSRLQITGNQLEITIHRKRITKWTPKPSHITYRYFVFIQNLDSGEIGIIDPEIEDENPA